MTNPPNKHIQTVKNPLMRCVSTFVGSRTSAADSKTKRCSNCKKEYPATIEYFHKNKHCNYGLDSRCKHCRKQYSYQNRIAIKCYKQEHRKENREYMKNYFETEKGHIRRLWNNITQRCNNSKNRGYKNYGGRGIEVEFISFGSFYNYIVYELKVDPRGLTIDRINNDGNYKKGNIRFVTRAENNRNKRLKYS